MLTDEERELAARAAEEYPPGHGDQWGVELAGHRYP